MRSHAFGDTTGPTSVLSSMPSPTLSASVASRSAGTTRSCAAPTVTSTEPAMPRWPAAPNAGPMTPPTVLSTTASGITTMWFFAPPSACTRLPAAAARSYTSRATGAEPTNETASIPAWPRIAAPPRRLSREPRHGGGADERDGVDPGVVEDALHDLAAAIHEVHHAVRQVEAVEHLERDLLRQRHLLRGLEHEGVAARDREGQEPERHHGREVEGNDGRAHADGLAHGL